MKILRIIKKILISIGQPLYFLIYSVINVTLYIMPKNKKLKINKIEKIRTPKKREENKKITFGFLSLILIISVVIIGLVEFYNQIIKDLPNVNQIYNPPKLSTKILDRNGNLLYKFYSGENRTWVPINKIPQSLINATIAIEDKDFYKHNGISFKGLFKAMIYDFKKDDDQKLRGGSTITQQLVKNVFLSSEKSFKRKIKEVILASLVELKLTKKEILEKYFNQVAYGGEIYGVEEAALAYFGKNIWELNTAQTAFLAGLPAAPSSYSPFGNNPELALIRQKHVIQEMTDAKFISKEDAKKIAEEKIEIKKENKKIEAPQFVFYIKNLLEEKYGFVNIERQGLTVKTTLDSDIQNMANKITVNEVKNIKKLGISNGASLIIDVKQGDILAMVGGVDGQYNVTTALRQPGSSIKPINYLLALENGETLNSVINDSPITYFIKGQKPYSPQNYNGKYLGPVTLKKALASSLNIPSVKLLAKNGVNNMISLGQEMGINTWQDKNRFGLSLALGAGEVKMTELAQAYSIFANMGEKIEINPILEIKNYLGEEIFNKSVRKKEIFGEDYAFLINSALSDDMARAPIFGLNSKLKIKDKTVAVKTGTTNSLRDNWCIGWTPNYLVATWVGNNDNTPMSWVASGITGATPIWNKIITEILKDKPDTQWATPSGIIKKNVCGRDEYFIQGTEDSVKCTNYISPTPTITQ
jgi:1A family penicillin-binding protein